MVTVYVTADRPPVLVVYPPLIEGQVYCLQEGRMCGKMK